MSGAPPVPPERISTPNPRTAAAQPTAEEDRARAPRVPPAEARRGDRSIPSLDGLRAISILFVLFGHLCGTAGFPVSVSFEEDFVTFSNLGVRVFFVISGYLITALLLREMGTRGRIDLPRFYLRRTFRLMPAYYAYLLVVVALALAGWTDASWRALLHAFTYTSNYNSADFSWAVAHTWSLAVEEQFYLLWPAVLLLAGVRRGLWIGAAFILAAPVFRGIAGLLLLQDPEAGYRLGFTFETVGDAVAVGCLLAGLRPWLWERARYRRFLQSGWIALVPLIVLLAKATGGEAIADIFPLSPAVHQLVGITVVNVGIAVCLDWCIRNPSGRVGRLLNSRVLVRVGIMSYSIYLWQQLFLDRLTASPLTAFPANLLLVAVTATLSFHLIEQPGLRLRDRVERRFLARRERHVVSETDAHRAEAA